MKKIYACLVGNWVCLNDDPNCVMGTNQLSPYEWWENNATVYAPLNRESALEHSYYGLNYIHIFYKGINYRINPIFIQIVTE